MNGPKRTPDAKRWSAAAVFVALIVGGLLLQQREADPEPPPVAVPAPAPKPPSEVQTVFTPPPPVGRAELIEAVDAAASAHAAGAPPPANVLAGRRFALRLPFGCFGPTDDPEAPLRWSYDAEEQSLRLSARPVVWTGPFLARVVAQGAEIEAAEGFWIERPWLRTETCPRPPAPGAIGPPPATPPTLGVAEFFEAGGARGERRNGKAYEAVVKVPPQELAAEQGFRLALEGRIAATGDGRPIGCLSESPAERPTCLVAARIDRVALENAATGESYAQWTE